MMFRREFTNLMVVSHLRNNQIFYSLSQNVHKSNKSASGSLARPYAMFLAARCLESLSRAHTHFCGVDAGLSFQNKH